MTIFYFWVEIPDLLGSWDGNGVNGLLGLPKAPRVNSLGGGVTAAASRPFTPGGWVGCVNAVYDSRLAHSQSAVPPPSPPPPRPLPKVVVIPTDFE